MPRIGLEISFDAENFALIEAVGKGQLFFSKTQNFQKNKNKLSKKKIVKK